MDHTQFAAANAILEFGGYCPICEQETTYKATHSWYRGYLRCLSCPNGSVPRERALAIVMNETVPEWRSMSIHESSPIDRGLSVKIRLEAKHYVPSQFYPDQPLGAYVNNFRNEDLQRQTFRDSSFDLFISQDVFEHIPDPQKAVSEVWRTLRPGGIAINTFPVRKWQSVSIERRVEFLDNGELRHLKPAEYHGNPISNDGALVTVDYGYDIHQKIAEWADFDVRVYRFNDRTHGILGEYTDVFTWKKR
jgi:SAM-dependent methyltransferase